MRDGLAAGRKVGAGETAPTEILAEQHYRKIATWLAPLGLDVVWLTGGLKKREKEAAIAWVGAGETAPTGIPVISSARNRIPP